MSRLNARWLPIVKQINYLCEKITCIVRISPTITIQDADTLVWFSTHIPVYGFTISCVETCTSIKKLYLLNALQVKRSVTSLLDMSGKNNKCSFG